MVFNLFNVYWPNSAACAQSLCFSIYAISASAAVAHCRRTRKPAFLHLVTTRLFGHAGSDVETAYRSAEEIAAGEASDPVLQTARLLLEAGVATPAQLEALAAKKVGRVRPLRPTADFRKSRLEYSRSSIRPNRPSASE